MRGAVKCSFALLGGAPLFLTAAHVLQEWAPRYFDVLRRIPATFIKQRYCYYNHDDNDDDTTTIPSSLNHADMAYSRPHIEQDAGGNVTAVHWSPPFMGPLHHDATATTTNANDYYTVDDYFLAYALYERLVDQEIIHEVPNLPSSIDPAVQKQMADYAQQYTWQRKLQPSEMLIFNNQRLLHGRRGFSAAAAAATDTEDDDDDMSSSYQRHLMGCYVDMDDVLIHYRILRRQQQPPANERLPRYHRSFGNGSSGFLCVFFPSGKTTRNKSSKRICRNYDGAGR